MTSLDYLTIINTNTKARRLGYLKALALFFSKYQKIPQNIISNRFEEFAFDYEQELSNYGNSKGLIKKTKTGVSAKPYLDLAREFGFISILTNLCSPGKSFKVYEVIKSELDSGRADNFFELTEFDKVFFLEVILKNDFLYCWCLLDYLKSNPTIDYSKLVEEFQSTIKAKIEVIKEYNDKISRHGSQLTDRISSWKKPQTYLEHIVMPRVNWLFDLGLCSIHENTFTLTLSGVNLSNSISEWVRSGNTLSTSINSSLMLVFERSSKSIEYKKFENLSFDTINKLEEYLLKAFQNFKTLAPNRVTASQAISYCKYRLFIERRLGLDSSTIEEYLKSNLNSRFIYKFQAQYGDGYIQIKPN